MNALFSCMIVAVQVTFGSSVALRVPNDEDLAGCGVDLALGDYAQMKPSVEPPSVCSGHTHAPNSFCFDAKNRDSYIEVAFPAATVVRRISIVAVDGMVRPKYVKVRLMNGVITRKWFLTVSDQEAGKGWSEVAVSRQGDAGSQSELLSEDMTATRIIIWPVFPQYKTNMTIAGLTIAGLTIALKGCKADVTKSLSLRFGSSFDMIRERFGDLGQFKNEMDKHICRLVAMMPPCNQRVVLEGIQESPAKADKGHETENGRIVTYKPLQDELKNVVLLYRVLPPSKLCQDCRSPGQVLSDMKVELSDPTTKAFKLAKAVEKWIEDDKPFFCVNTKCAKGHICVNGVCIDADGGEHRALYRGEGVGLEGRDSFLANPMPGDVQKYKYDEAVVRLKPLPVIKGVREPDPPRFVKPVVKSRAGTVQSVSSVNLVDAAEISVMQEAHRRSISTTDHGPWYVKRLVIPIIVVVTLIGVVAIIILGRICKWHINLMKEKPTS